MLRRDFLGAALGCTAIAWPSIATAQPPSNKVWRIGYLYPGSLALPADSAIFGVFRAEMRTLGYVEGENLIIDQRSAEGKFQRLPGMASDLIALRPDAIVAVTTPAIAAAQKATSTVPIIMAPSINPIGFGFIKSLARPGGNITGLSSMSDDLMGKTAELFRTLLPHAKRIAVLMSNNPSHLWQYEMAEAAMKKVGLVAVRIMAPTPDDLAAAFDTIKKENCEGLFSTRQAVRNRQADEHRLRLQRPPLGHRIEGISLPRTRRQRPQ